ncbi:L-tryptophan--pyruvate aminotransferase 1-like [Salvia hispanica]|uniref:L-tryptophan--pyruvate aminotransferase 1-like n=1 Tax=Salvia hispanica TaxID=49212 RepID=UPI002008F99F|nr:L-tryptophan--pyruvate aminotransferase 1-like [Salvia hispanica]
MCGTYEVIVTKSPCSDNQAPDSNGSTPNHVRTNGIAPHHHHPQPIVSLDHGDPTMYEEYWKKAGQRCSVTMSGFQSLSYFGDGKTLCWFMEKKLEDEIRKLHKVAGNAVVDGKHIVVGTGSSQLILAALYALAYTLDIPNPVDVISAAPYYSSYPEMIEFLRTGLFKWSGDARCFDKDVPYIEFVTSPNNPDGSTREATVMNRGELGMLVHDLAYYWPQYTAITSAADHDLMLFTASKCTGHAGSRIGWAVVRDENVARKMVKFIEMNTIGVSKEAQLRSASVMELISLSCQKRKPCDVENFFDYSQCTLADRWKRLRDVVTKNQLFSLPKFPANYCNFRREVVETYPAFAWMKCKEGIDGERLLREHKIGTRSGRRFGCEADYVRISMLSRDEDFDLFLHRLSTIQPTANGNQN